MPGDEFIELYLGFFFLGLTKDVFNKDLDKCSNSFSLFFSGLVSLFTTVVDGIEFNVLDFCIRFLLVLFFGFLFLGNIYL